MTLLQFVTKEKPSILKALTYTVSDLQRMIKAKPSDFIEPGCDAESVITKYADVATGIGHSARSAFHDALEQLCNCYDVASLEVEADKLSDEDTVRPLLEECSDEESELYHHVSVRVLGEESC